VIRLIRSLVRPYRWSLVLVLSAMIVETLMSVAGPWPLKVVLDNVVGTHHLPSWLVHLLVSMPDGAGKREIALWAAVGFILIAAIGAAASYLDSYWSESVAQNVAHDLRLRTYHHLQRLSLSYHDKHQTSASLSTLTTDIETIQDFASSGTLAILVDTLSVLGMLVLMFWLNLEFALVAALAAPFLLWFVSRIRSAVKKATKQVRLIQAEIVAVEIQDLQSQRVVEAFGTQELEEARLRNVSRAAVQSALKARRIKSSVSPLVSVTVAACTAFVLWRGAGLVLAGAMTAGTLTVFLAYLAQFFKPVRDLAKMTNSIAQTAVAAERIETILETEEIIPERPNARIPSFLRGEIIFDHVGFRYHSEQPVLRDVSFRIEPGQFVGIVGPTGSGKSTVISLIPRFYDATAGRVLIDGVDVRDYQLQGLRKQFGFVLQDTVLFSRHCSREHRLRPARCHKGGDRRGSATGQCPRVHRTDALRVRNHSGRARNESVGRAKATAGHRARPGPQQPDPDSRRADCGPRRGCRRAGDGSAGAADERPDRGHDRAPFSHPARCGQSDRGEGRGGDGRRHSRPPPVAGRRLLRAAQGARGRLECGGRWIEEAMCRAR